MMQNHNDDLTSDINLPQTIHLKPKTQILAELFCHYFSKQEVEAKITTVLQDAGLCSQELVNPQELANLEKSAERLLSGATGAAMAHILIRDSLLFTPDEMHELEQSYSRLLSQLKISPNQLRQQLDYAKEKEDLATQYSKELESTVEQRTDELKSALEKLQSAQSQLIETEKQASLGKLVAGIAHEINTPIGICLTATTHLEQETKLINTLYQEGKLSERELEEFFQLCNESTDIMLKNNERASHLIRSFKQIAVDQSSDELRYVNIRKYLNENLLSLRPELKKHDHIITINCDEDLACKLYAGTLSQVITNLVMNSIIHGYDEDQQGNILIQAEMNNERHFCLTYKDDGKGLSQQAAKLLFDPFYTTRRSSGGSGLGAHLIHNLVTQKLGGSVTIETSPGQGLGYFIRFPIVN